MFMYMYMYSNASIVRIKFLFKFIYCIFTYQNSIYTHVNYRDVTVIYNILNSTLVRLNTFKLKK